MNIIQRAYELAQSEECKSLDAVERLLKIERFEKVVEHLASPSVRRDLNRIIREKRAKQIPPLNLR